MNWRPGFWTSLLVSSLACAVAASPLDRSALLSFTRLGALEVGMTVADAESALHLKLPEDERASDEPEGYCHYAINEAELPGIVLMIEDSKIVRLDVTTAGYRTARGAHVGMTQAEIIRLYPGIRNQPDPYWGRNLVLTSRDGKFAVLFVTDGKVVTSMRAGRREAVHFDEGCE
jgi:hypothetical protein